MEGSSGRSDGSRDEASHLRVLRCRGCGDTFPSDASEPVRCPLCGGTEIDEAVEPLL